MTGRPSARLAVLAAGLLLAGALSLNFAAADPTGSSPAPPTTETSATTTTTTTTTTTSEPPSTQPSPPELRAPVAPAEEPQVEVTAAFDQPSYRTSDLVTITLRIKNIGPERAVGLRADNDFRVPTDLVFDLSQWGDLSFGRPGVTIDPGATHETRISGHVKKLDAEVVTLTGGVWAASGRRIKEFAFSAPVTKSAQQVAGTIFGDRNGNAVFDQGEALPDITITWRYIHNFDTKFTATSDASGRFDFGEIPAASYFTGSEVVGGWLIPFRRIEISQSTDNTKQLVRAVPPLNGALSAKMSFTKDSYKPGELAHVTVALSNSGPLPLNGIVAACNRAGFFDRGLSGRGPGWGALIGDGVSIPAGQTKTFDVSENVPDGAIHVGEVSVGCDFGYAEVDIENHATAGDVALVPGGSATLVGDVLFYPEGPGAGKPQQGISGVKAVLVDKRECPIMGERTTDANGHFEFRDLKPGHTYLVYFLPPQGWKVKWENPSRSLVFGPPDRPNRLIIEVEKGDGPLPTVPTHTGGCTTTTTTATSTTTPAPQARSSSGLASTGASVIGLGGLGLVALLLGAGVLVAARRRRAS